MKPHQITVLTQVPQHELKRTSSLLLLMLMWKSLAVNNPEGQIKAYFYLKGARFQTLKMLS